MFQLAPQLTNRGREFYYRNLGGERLVFTKIQMGSGTLSTSILTMTALVEPVVTLDAYAQAHTDYVTVSGQFSNAGMTEGFWWKEVGVFVADPDDLDNRDADILYCYQNAYDKADYLNSAAEGTIEKVLNMPIIVGDAASVSAVLDASLVAATKKELEEAIAGIDLSGLVPNTRKVNGKALSSDITLTAEDIDNVAKLGSDGLVLDAQLRRASKAVFGVVKVKEGNGLVIINGELQYQLTEVAVPSQSGTLTYTGAAQSPTWGGFDEKKMTISGTTSATVAGTYSAVFSLVQGYIWEDESTAAKIVTWTIGKTAGSLSLSASSASIIGASGATKAITVTRAGDGAITAVSSNTSVATVSVNGTTVTIKAVATGSATITVSVAEGTNHTAPESAECTVTTETASTTLNDNDWATIRQISDAGLGESYWSVGDAKAVTLNGTVGALDMSGTYYCFILGFDHNSSREGSNRIHFQFGKTAASSGVDIAFVDSNYGSDDNTTGFRMNLSATNSGGWNSSYMRGSICTAFKEALPSDLQVVLKTVTKYTDNTGGGSDVASYVTATTDTVFLLSEFEVFGVRTGANSAEQNYQTQYSYYANGNSKVKYRHSATTTTSLWFLRSVSTTGNPTIEFRAVSAAGATTSHISYFSRGFASCFCV